jgi:hypothetical protein
MANFTAGTSFSDGVTNDVTAAKLNALVADAVPTSNLSLNSTTGTIATFNSTTGTIATLNSTTGTIATFNSTTGTIPTLVATTLITTGTGTAAAPAIVPTGDTNTGIFFPAADTIAFAEGGAEAMRIDSSGNVGVGTASPLTKLDVRGAGYVGELNVNYGIGTNGNAVINGGTNLYLRPQSGGLICEAGGVERLNINSSGNVGIGETNPQKPLHVKSSSAAELLRLQSPSNTGQAFITYYKSGGTRKAYIGYASSVNEEFFISNDENGPMSFYTFGTERLRIDSSGNVLIGKTSTSLGVAGTLLTLNANEFVCDSTVCQSLNRLTNDGALVNFYQAGSLEGSISVSGTTVSYNGGHLSRYSQLPSGQRDPAIKKGTVLSNLDAMCEWRDADGNLLPNEQLNKVKISDVEGDLNTAGVFVNWDNDDQDNPYDLNMAMTGDMIIRIAQGTSVNRGDLLMSAGDGTAKPQGDDIIRSKTIAKVTSTNVTCTYEDGSYCIPCVLMAC